MLFPPCLWLWTTLFSLMVILDPQSTKCSNKLTQSFNLLCGLFLWIHRLFHIHSLETSCNDSPISKTTQLNRQQKAKEETCINGKPDGLKLLIKEQELPWCPPPNGPLENSWGCTCWRALQSASPDWLETRICTGEFPSTPAWLLAHLSSPKSLGRTTYRYIQSSLFHPFTQHVMNIYQSSQYCQHYKNTVGRHIDTYTHIHNYDIKMTIPT